MPNRAYVRPADLRLIVGKDTVARLGKGYALAVNASYFNPGDYVIASDVAQGGKVLGGPGLNRPWLGFKDGRVWFGRGQIDPSTVDWAAGAGPMLLEGGKKPALAPGEKYGSDIVPGGETVTNKRMAVGITREGNVCFIALTGTFADLRRELLACGCVDGMNLDGGSSTQWVQGGRLLFGSPRTIPVALAATAVIEEQKPFTVFISASHQLKNLGVAPAFGGSVGYCEGYTMQQYALTCAKALPYKAVIPDHDDDLATVCDKSDISGANLFVEWHSNANDDPTVYGCNIYVVALGGRAERFARILAKHLEGVTGPDGLPIKATIRTADFLVLKDTAAPAVLIELAFHTNEKDLLWLLDPNTQITVAAANTAAVKEYKEG